MAEKRFLKGSEEWQMFQDYWNLCQSFWEPEYTDEYWAAVVKAEESFVEKYKTEFAAELVRVFRQDLLRRDKLKRGGN